MDLLSSPQPLETHTHIAHILHSQNFPYSNRYFLMEEKNCRANAAFLFKCVKTLQ